MSKKLVAYFSATGTTKKMAEAIAQAESADLLEITPEKSYTPEDLNWRNRGSRSTVEQNDPSARPAVKNDGADLSAYDVIYLGFPIWWYTYPRIIDSFFDAHNLDGKKIVPFCTSGGTKISRAEADIKTALKGKTAVEEGRLLNGAPDLSMLKKWADNY